MVQQVLAVLSVALFCHVTTATDLICRTEKPCTVDFKALGCYKDYANNRALPNYIYNERDPTNSNFGGRWIDWYNWENYMPGFACRCAKKAQELGYDLFGFQFYGECWAGHSNLHKSGLTNDDAICVGDGYKSCGVLDKYCAGTRFSNFVYQIVNTNCDIEFAKVGCFKDSHIANARPLANYALNDRDKNTVSYSGQLIDWRNWDVYLKDFACRCARAARNNGSTYFGLQFYGECWTHPQGSETYGRDGPATNCINNCYKPCKMHPFCMGVQFSNFVYRIKGQETCDVSIESIGCYKENPDARVLKEELVNAKYPPSDIFYGEMENPERWSSFFPGFLCKCAHEAKIKGYPYFGVSDNGVCYSDMLSQNYNNLGNSLECYEGKPSRACVEGSMACCGHTKTANYIYKITIP